MCGIFGIIAPKTFSSKDKKLKKLVYYSQQRGKDASGFITFNQEKSYQIYKADHCLSKLYKILKNREIKIILGHSRLVTNGQSDNQPVTFNNIAVIHNGIIVNHESLWRRIGKKPNLKIDTEIIPALFSYFQSANINLNEIPQKILEVCEGVISCAVVLLDIGKICLFSNNNSLYIGNNNDVTFFASEKYPLLQIGVENVQPVLQPVFLDIPKSTQKINSISLNARNYCLIPSLSINHTEEKLLEHTELNLLRCTKCVLPETMPFINFDNDGVCNYCRNYTRRNAPRGIDELHRLVEPYKSLKGNNCIIPFSGGRDSTYGLHLIKNELNLNPITYTYDWGMVTDLARRNISRVCAELGVENIIIADDIKKKRKNIKKNLLAWLKSPHLGMVSILTAGDKHFFNHIEKVKLQTGIGLNLWGVCPLEVTYFKAGFLGIAPDFEEKYVYSNGALKQFRYQWLRFKAMLESPKYFNSSLWDTLSGEYYRSFKKKDDYFHIFDFWKWDEKIVEKTLDDYNWERAPDTKSTWRIGDGTAAFYNYIYYTMAGFTEHDTFRSNQVREGDLTREKALELVSSENRPRYLNIKWYLDAINMDFTKTINVINKLNLANNFDK